MSSDQESLRKLLKSTILSAFPLEFESGLTRKLNSSPDPDQTLGHLLVGVVRDLMRKNPDYAMIVKLYHQGDPSVRHYSDVAKQALDEYLKIIRSAG